MVPVRGARFGFRRPSALCGIAKSPVMMRVRKNVPQFTIRLSRGIVNGFSLVSTGFLPIFPVFIGICLKNRPFSADSGPKSIAQKSIQQIFALP
jgi:hypothetical protein